MSCDVPLMKSCRLRSTFPSILISSSYESYPGGCLDLSLSPFFFTKRKGKRPCQLAAEIKYSSTDNIYVFFIKLNELIIDGDTPWFYFSWLQVLSGWYLPRVCKVRPVGDDVLRHERQGWRRSEVQWGDFLGEGKTKDQRKEAVGWLSIRVLTQI